ncbi:MAG: hypothetical protein AAF716_20515 [Cyanobacteria bacterium P01_D01_bin.1]
MASRSSQSNASSTVAPTKPAKTFVKNPVAARKVALRPVQRQYADILSFMAKNQLHAPVLGVAWDSSSGSNILWGGEFLQPTQSSTQYGFDQVARFLPYALPIADQTAADHFTEDYPIKEGCALEPRRSALGLLYSCYGESVFEMADLAPMRFFTHSQLAVLRETLSQKRYVLTTSSVGRMFDGIASLLNLHHYIGLKGQAARTLEFAATQSSTRSSYPFSVTEGQPVLIDWREIVKAIVEDCHEAVMTPIIAAKFHNTLVEIVVEIAHRTNNSQIVLAGSCFQNKVLIERAIRRLSAEGFTPYWIERTTG